MNDNIRIAIDGPAAAGKSTVARLVAARLSYVYIDTGAMYRALTLKVLTTGMNPEDGPGIKRLLKETQIELIPGGEGQHVHLDGVDVSRDIRKAEVSQNVSIVAKHQEVREEMVNRQRSLARGGGVVMDGRDIGTHVIPDAEVKIFLSASVETRARRRHEENIRKGFDSDLDQMKQDIIERDRLDSERETAPLIKADDAVEVNSTQLTIEQVVDQVMDIVAERAG